MKHRSKINCQVCARRWKWETTVSVWRVGVKQQFSDPDWRTHVIWCDTLRIPHIVVFVWGFHVRLWGGEASIRPPDGGGLRTFAVTVSPLAINRHRGRRLWPRTSTLGRFLSVPFQADGWVSVIGRRSGRSSDRGDTVAREHGEEGREDLTHVVGVVGCDQS